MLGVCSSARVAGIRNTKENKASAMVKTRSAYEHALAQEGTEVPQAGTTLWPWGAPPKDISFLLSRVLTCPN